MGLERDLIAYFNFCFNGVDIDTLAMKSARNNRVLRATDDRCAERNHLPDEIRALARDLPGQISSQTPADEMNFLLRSASEGGDFFQHSWQQIAHISRVPAESPATRP